MSTSNYSGDLKLKDIKRKVKSKLPDNYTCPIGHKVWIKECPSCNALYGDHSDVFS